MCRFIAVPCGRWEEAGVGLLTSLFGFLDQCCNRERTISVLLTGLQESEVLVTIDENISTSCKLTATRILYCAVDFTFLNATVTSETCAWCLQVLHLLHLAVVMSALLTWMSDILCRQLEEKANTTRRCTQACTLPLFSSGSNSEILNSSGVFVCVADVHRAEATAVKKTWSEEDETDADAQSTWTQMFVQI